MFIKIWLQSCIVVLVVCLNILIKCPGDGYFKRFKKENPDALFLHFNQKDKYKYDDIGLTDWVFDNERFIRKNNDGSLLESTKSIFLVESQTLLWRAERDVSFKVVVNNFLRISY